jgi:hypothetical protein
MLGRLKMPTSTASQSKKESSPTHNSGAWHSHPVEKRVARLGNQRTIQYLRQRFQAVTLTSD